MEEYNIRDDMIILNRNQPYLRPCLCRGEFREAGMILAGINPATSIYPSEMSVQEYWKLLSDYDAFMDYYKDRRVRENKSAVSRTRQGIQSFVDWVNRELGMGVIESDICTYPTKSVKELDSADKRFLEAGREMFWKVLCESRANILVIYGTRAFRDFLSLLLHKGITLNMLDKFYCEEELGQLDSKELEKISPIMSIQLGDRKIIVYAVRHLMYYGKNGASYDGFKKKLLKECRLR